MTKKMLFPTPKAVIEQIPISDDMEAVTTALQEWKGAGGVPLPVTYSSKLHKELQKCGWDILDQKTIVKKEIVYITPLLILGIILCIAGIGAGVGLMSAGKVDAGILTGLISVGGIFFVFITATEVEERSRRR